MYAGVPISGPERVVVAVAAPITVPDRVFVAVAASVNARAIPKSVTMA
jgi:hypothetical protein